MPNLPAQPAANSIVYSQDGDAGTVKEVRGDRYLVRWDGFDLSPHVQWVRLADLGERPPTAWERMREQGIVR